MFVFFRLTLINWGDGPLAGARLQGRPGLAWPRTPEAAEVPSPGPSSESRVSERLCQETQWGQWCEMWPRTEADHRMTSPRTGEAPILFILVLIATLVCGRKNENCKYWKGRLSLNIVESELLAHLSSLIFPRAMSGYILCLTVTVSSARPAGQVKWNCVKSIILTWASDCSHH